jgi:hypothetical protein
MLRHPVGAAKKRSFINIYDYRIQLNVYAIRKPASARKK